LTRYNDTVAMKFIPPMLSEVLRDPARLEDPRYVAEPKFDGQRAEVHVESSQTVAAYSRRSLDLLRHAGLAWLRDVRWAVSQAVLDGELCGDTGSDGIQSVLKARGRRDGVTSFVAFDLLQVAGEDLIREPWADRRKRLEDLGTLLESPRIAIVPVAEDAARLSRERAVVGHTAAPGVRDRAPRLGLRTALTLTPLTSVSRPPMASSIASAGSLGRVRQGHRLWRSPHGTRPRRGLGLTTLATTP
jgi:ATP dependent DNA ligase domain